MANKKKALISAGIATALMFMLLLPPFCIKSQSGDKIRGATGWDEWGEKYWPTKPVRGGYFRRATTRYVGLMNPNHWPVNDWVALTYFYEKLVNRDGAYRASVPWLATSWKFLDPLTVVMKLQEGVKFHDGSDFNAESVAYQIHWIKNKKNGAWPRAYLRALKSVEVMDEYTVKWRFKKPWGAFLGSLPAGIPGWQLSSEGLKKGKKYMDTNPIGTGQWILEEANPGNYLKVKRNPNWWFAKASGHPDMPYFDGIIVLVIPDPSVRLANLRAGKIDSLGIDKASYALVKNDPNLNVYLYSQNNMGGLRFNHAKGPCKDIRVRKAISHAIDRKALIAGTQFGLVRLASCLYPGDHWAHNPNLKPVKYNPELSKKLLAEAGYPNGLTIRGYMGNDTMSLNVAEAIKSMLAQVNINWQVDALDSAAASDRMRNLEYDLAAGHYSWIWEPDLVATNLFHPHGGFNYGRSNNKKAIALIEAGKNETDLVKRQKIYHELEKVLYDNYEDVWIWWEIAIVAYRKNVQGWNNEMWKKYREAYSNTHPLWFKDGKP